VDALRFLALVSREPFDYQQWRKEYFSHYNVDELLDEVRTSRPGKAPELSLVPYRVSLGLEIPFTQESSLSF
jgi:hypothetical protein